MKTTIGVYATHEKAIEVVMELKSAGFPVHQLSLIGKSFIIDDLMHISNNRWSKNRPALVGVVIGPILGILTGVKIITIPGFSVLFGAGALLGALAGFSIGIVCGGIISLISIMVIKNRTVLKYREHIKKKGFLVIAHGTNEEINQAKEILEKHHEKPEIIAMP